MVNETVKNRISIFKIFILLALGFWIFSSCQRKEGCTFPLASNYDSEAEIEDGSCIYHGCMDKMALNYDPRAQEDDGSCNYGGTLKFFTSAIVGNGQYIEIELDGFYAGRLQQSCPDTIVNCQTGCGFSPVYEIEEGLHTYRSYYVLQFTSENIDTLSYSNQQDVYVNPNDCIGILLEF